MNELDATREFLSEPLTDAEHESMENVDQALNAVDTMFEEIDVETCDSANEESTPRSPLSDEDRLTQWRADVLNARETERLARNMVVKFESSLAELKAELKAARERWEKTVQRLGGVIDSLDRPMNTKPNRVPR